MRRLRAAVSWAAILVATAGLAFWAGTNAVVPPRLPDAKEAQAAYAVAMGTVGRSVRIAVTASWPTVRTLSADRDGVVTSIIHAAGKPAGAGDVLLTIDLEPLVIAKGAVPMFRTLRQGSEGPDVAQFQKLLKSRGFLDGPADRRFDAATTAAVKRWQRSIHARADGVVRPGDLVFVDRLPVRLEVIASVGQHVSVGSDLVRFLGSRPEFVVTVTGSQRAELTSGLGVDIQAPEGSAWHGSLGVFEQLGDGRYKAAIAGTLCGERCSLVAMGGETALQGSIELVPDTQGLVVPTSALTQGPSGRLAVTLVDGTTRDVTVKAEADGFAVVEGIEQGAVIRLPSPPAS